MVHDTLLPWCSYLDDEAEPSIVAGGQRAAPGHARSRAACRRPAPSVLELVTALHPTPAVGGSPRDAALDAHRPTTKASTAAATPDRSAGSTPTGNGTWAVGIRSPSIDGTTARVFAGVGIVADSDPDTELAETRAKFQALLGALVRP